MALGIQQGSKMAEGGPTCKQAPLKGEVASGVATRRAYSGIHWHLKLRFDFRTGCGQFLSMKLE
jgi:hypothetical protein